MTDPGRRLQKAAVFTEASPLSKAFSATAAMLLKIEIESGEAAVISILVIAI
ncbi:MAG TPA: hypothetical protein VFC10_15560 [Terriglobia bacterium]|jgi:hypothetical protein|nr:hypothetical protein [Terriglobia bacterium]